MPDEQKRSLLASYSGGQYLRITCGEEAKQRLKLLGCFGVEVNRKKRKGRQGPSDVQIECILAIQLEPQVEESGQARELSISECWKRFRHFNQTSNIKLDFAIEYAVYHYFRTRGWIVKSAINYGTHFLLYKENQNDSMEQHSQYAVLIIPELTGAANTSQEQLYDWHSLLTFHRVIQSVSKQLLLAFVFCKDPNESLPLDLDQPACIRNLAITTRVFAAGHVISCIEK